MAVRGLGRRHRARIARTPLGLVAPVVQRMASCASDHQLWGRSELRFAYVPLLLTLYRAWTAWPRIANATLPAINGLCVAGVVAVCLLGQRRSPESFRKNARPGRCTPKLSNALASDRLSISTVVASRPQSRVRMYDTPMLCVICESTVCLN